MASSRLWSPLLLSLLWLATALPAQDATMRSDLRVDGDAWVGERVRLYLTVLSPQPFESNPHFDLPRIPGVVLLKVPSRPTVGATRVDGTEYQTQRHAFAIYAQRAGEIEIPPILARFRARPAPGQPPVDQRTETAPLRLTTRMPPGAEGLSHVITTEQLDVSDRWDPQPGPAKVGDAFTRTITFRAREILGMALPQLPIQSAAGLRVYPRDPTTRDQVSRGAITGTSVQTFVYVCERDGSFSVPPMTIRWFERGSGAMRQQTLDAVTFEVEAAPQGAAEATYEPQRSSNVLGWLLAVAALVAVALLWRRFGAAIRDAWQAREAAFLRRAAIACRSGDAATAVQRLYEWRARAGDRGRTLGEWARATDDESLVREIAELERAFGDRTPWSGAALADRITRQHRAAVKFTRRSRRAPALAPLNPAD